MLCLEGCYKPHSPPLCPERVGPYDVSPGGRSDAAAGQGEKGLSRLKTKLVAASRPSQGG